MAVESNRVSHFDRDLHYLGDLTENVHGPWGITFDPRGTMYVANFARDPSERAPDLKARNRKTSRVAP